MIWSLLFISTDLQPVGKVKKCGSSPVIHVEDKIRLTVGRASYDQSVVVQSGRKPEINRKIHRCRNTAELGESGSCEKKSGFFWRGFIILRSMRGMRKRFASFRRKRRKLSSCCGFREGFGRYSDLWLWDLRFLIGLDLKELPATTSLPS